jgi:hypothetical protein
MNKISFNSSLIRPRDHRLRLVIAVSSVKHFFFARGKAYADGIRLYEMSARQISVAIPRLSDHRPQQRNAGGVESRLRPAAETDDVTLIIRASHRKYHSVTDAQRMAFIEKTLPSLTRGNVGGSPTPGNDMAETALAG